MDSLMCVIHVLVFAVCRCDGFVTLGKEKDKTACKLCRCIETCSSTFIIIIIIIIIIICCSLVFTRWQ